jgi:hypothetical protein
VALLGASAGAFVLAALATTSVAQAAEPTLNVTDVTLAPTPSADPAVDSARPDGELTEPVTQGGDTPLRQADDTTALVVPQATESTAPLVKEPAEKLAPVPAQVDEIVAPVIDEVEKLAPVAGQVDEVVAPVIDQVEKLAPVAGQVDEIVTPVVDQAEVLAPVVQQPADDDAFGVPSPAEGDGRGSVVRSGRSESPAPPEVETAVTGCPMGAVTGPPFPACRSDPGDRPGDNRWPRWPEPQLPASTVSPVTAVSGGTPNQSPAATASGVTSTANGGGTSNGSPEATVDVAATGLSARAPPATGEFSGGPRQRERIPPTTPD